MEKLRVLIIEDEPTNGVVIKKQLGNKLSILASKRQDFHSKFKNVETFLQKNVSNLKWLQTQ